MAARKASCVESIQRAFIIDEADPKKASIDLVFVWGSSKAISESISPGAIAGLPNLSFTIIASIGAIFQEILKDKVNILNILIFPFFLILIWINLYFTVSYYKEEFEKAFDLEKAVEPIKTFLSQPSG